MRFVQLLSCASAVSAFDFLPDIFQRRNRQQVCQVFTIIEYPCEVSTWVASNTTLWIESCSTSISVTNAPTGFSTTLTSTTTLGVTTTTTVTLSLLTTAATLSTTITLHQPPPPTSTLNPPTSTLTLANGTTSTTPAASIAGIGSTMELAPSGTISTSTSSPASSSCVPSTNYPPAELIPSNTTYIIEVTSPVLTAENNGVKVFLLSGGGITYNPDLAIQVFFYNGILFSSDAYFGVRWYATDIADGHPVFTIQQYAANSQVIARDFSTVPGTMDLVWNNCEFGNTDVIFQFEPVDGLVHSWFSGTPPPFGNSVVVTLVLEAPTSTAAVSSSASPIITVLSSNPATSFATSSSALPTYSPPSTSSLPESNDIPANTTYLLEPYFEPSPGIFEPYYIASTYLTRTGGTVTGAAGAVNVFFVDGGLAAADPIFIYGFYAANQVANVAPYNEPFQLMEYLPNAGLITNTFTMTTTTPPLLMWQNCFDSSAAEWVLDSTTGNIYVVFNGNGAIGPLPVPISLALIPYGNP
ncbi:uncharacterized protein PAC_02149 [Phialocephala subalpina]|uniref:Uncharacterized protein n=1 Tax=Phialocephala subalpina TaxID=576137 RepID=A0A1L7WHP7_9HELO|nr:uncharacterized protein PAC_02149 [Phialocephala subalpina]